MNQDNPPDKTRSRSCGDAIREVCSIFGIEGENGFLGKFSDDRKSDSYLFGWYWALMNEELNILYKDHLIEAMKQYTLEEVVMGYKDCKAEQDQL